MSPRFPDELEVYRTELGTQLCADSLKVLSAMPDAFVDLVLTSPPFALLRKKSYGNENQADYLKWIDQFGRQVFRVLKDTGSFVLDLGGAYQQGRPVRSLYNYRVLLHFCDDIGFRLAEEFFWYNPAKLPSPIEWVNKRKIRVKDSVNTVWWFSKTDNPKADVTRVLAPYSQRMKALLSNPERFYRPKERPSGHAIAAAFANDRGGSIPSNLLQIPNTDSNSHYLRVCKELARDAHPARFPKGIPDFFVRFLTDPGDLVLDIFSGSNVTGSVSEELRRNWASIEIDRDFSILSAVRFMQDWKIESIRSSLSQMGEGKVLVFQSTNTPDQDRVVVQDTPPKQLSLHGQ